jgi:L-ascorbate metabolism protein UlaG (beta-lactamase superfamily)
VRLEKLDDYQSWLVRVSGANVLVDPWLTDSFAFSQGRWLFHRDRAAGDHRGVGDLPPIDLIVVTSHFADHLVPDTLNNFDRGIRVVGSRAAMTKMRKLGFINGTAMRPGDCAEVGRTGSVTAVAPGFPYSRNSIGLRFSESDTRASVYLETHVISRFRPQPPVDAVITTVESVRLFGIQLGMDATRTLRTVERIRPAYLIPTGDRPGSGGGLLSRLLSVKGSVAALENEWQRRRTSVKLAYLGPGQSLDLP